MADTSIILGYGYRRRKQRLIDAGANRILIDTDDEKFFLKEIRKNMGITLRPGDTLLLLSITDLGPRPTHLLKCLGDWKVSVQIAGHEPVMPSTKEQRDQLVALKANTPYRETKRRRGRPKYFDPTAEQARIIRSIWETEGMMPKHKVKLIGDVLGKAVEYHHVRDWYARQSN